MEPFLKLVAEDLYDKLEGDLSHTAVVFPNKRAGLFFNEYLAFKSNKPMWAPAYISISELFRSLSDWEIGDSIQLVCELYKIFVEATHSKETLDEFYFWGELLIADFDDIDKNLVDAERLLGNLQALKDLEGTDFLTPGQEEAVQQFFQNFSLAKTTELKQRFISLWSVLNDIYTHYREQLAEKKIAYEGMLYREVIEHLEMEKLPYDRYVFVGFNVLNKVEYRLFKYLRDIGKALFYWDYDVSYLNIANHEAGEFIRRNLVEFPSPLPPSCFDNYSHLKEIRYLEASTENVQARFLSDWLRENLTEKESETAVVLCNEALLQPVFHSLPDDAVKHVNITMGFPLAQTPVYSFLKNLVKLQIDGYNEDSGRYIFEVVSAVLKHSYTCCLSPLSPQIQRELTKKNRFYPLPSELQRDEMLTLIFTPLKGNLELCIYLEEILKRVAALYQDNKNKKDVFDPLYRESLFKAYTAVGRFRLLIEEGDLCIQPKTFVRLLLRVLSSSSVPFHGEPAIGLQVMGVLETRNLDFKCVAMLSLNEGKLPKTSGDSSFIPYNLRKAFGMTLIEHKSAIYAYYFYRLMQRAEKAVLLYNSSTDGLNRGEMSRFMLQMLVESPHKIKKEFITAGQVPQISAPIIIKKTESVMRRLLLRFDSSAKKILSPSALNAYLSCRVKFYFLYVAQLSPKEEVSAEIDSATFGSIFHRAAQLVYMDLTSTDKQIHKNDIERVLKDKARLEHYVDSAFKELFFKVTAEEKPEYNGLQLLNSEVIVMYLRQLLEKDLHYAPFVMEGMEKWVDDVFEVEVDGQLVQLRVGGIIDRIDSKDGRIRIVDYKTGGEPRPVENIESLFIPSESRSGYIFQTFLYAAIMTKKQSVPVAPALLYIHKAASSTYSPVITIGDPYKPKVEVTDFREYNEEFRKHLQKVLQEIYNPEEPFRQTEFDSQCGYCDFKTLCRRK